MSTEVVRSAPRGISRWLAGWRVAVRLALSNLRATPGRLLFTASAFATGIAFMGGVSLAPVPVTIGLTIMTVTALGAARIPDPVRMRTSAMLSLVGAPGALRRRIVVVDVAISAALAAVPGAVLSTLVAHLADDNGNARPAATWGAAFPIAIAALVGGRGEEVVFRPLRSARRARLSGGARLAAAGVLVTLGSLAPGTARSSFDLDLTLIPGLLLVSIGLSLVAPMLLLVVGRLLSRAGRRASAHLAGSLVIDRRRALAPAACLVAAGTVAVVAQAVLGTGLAAREADRRATFDLRAGTGADQVTVGDGWSGPGIFSSPPSSPGFVADFLTTEDVAAIGAAAPEGIVAPFAVPFATRPEMPSYIFLPGFAGESSLGWETRLVAMATPELLRALDLGRFESDLSAGRALVLDPDVLAGDGSVALWNSGSALDGPDGPHAAPTLVPGRVVPGFEKATRLPAAIVGESVLQEKLGVGPDRVLRGAVVRLPHRASAAEVEAIASAVPGSLQSTVLRGDTLDVERRDEGRLDAAGSVVIQSSADAIGGVLLVGVLGLAALLVGLRFAALANRAEDDLFEVVGAPAFTLRRIAAWQGALVTVIGVLLGLVVGLIGTASGISRYNSSGRGDLPPIPFGVPGPLLVGLMVLPLAGAAVAWASAGRRPAVDPVLLAERMGW